MNVFCFLKNRKNLRYILTSVLSSIIIQKTHVKSIRLVELHFYQINTRRYCWIDRGIVQLVEQRSPKPFVVGSNPTAPAKKSKSKDLDFFICVRRTQHHLSATHATSFRAKREYHCPLRTQMNEVALRANDVLRNDVGLRPTMLRFAQTEFNRSLGVLKYS